MIFKNTAHKKEFKTLTYPHMKLLYNVALKYCGNVFDAEDIVQETYLMAFNKFHQLREKSKCKSWLLRILRNNFLKSYHKKKSRQKLTETDYIEFLKASIAVNNPENMLAKASTRQAVQKAMDQLPEKYKEVLMLFYMDELLYKDIADALQIPIGTVMSRLTRAREGLKVHLLKQMNLKNNPNILTLRQVFPLTANDL
ncbi:MAG: sigma-70 family RNA polymerase sigma factor [Proteobacteria bacterium]|nr:sigma-70 family RNA polymerase sigma factor [Pseudomonadota bacterium]MBU1583626.1 sigma-70 family RNA polymerase sigma factor [Pseudomonadota bacterium]MBU2456075.1 sigma-70 family RNA polymerase sigma factor [Pseudomonadota bacterium]MBU2629728.1 sigma-70 family RNA polymerase sigma factor [Pseudomonadota bacterium]